MGDNTRIVFSVEEAAEKLDMSYSTLYKRIREGRVPYRLMPNGRMRLTQADIDQILADAYRPAVA